jgi:hypothetical protein
MTMMVMVMSHISCLVLLYILCYVVNYVSCDINFTSSYSFQPPFESVDMYGKRIKMMMMKMMVIVCDELMVGLIY